jgi:hypothetical protein
VYIYIYITCFPSESPTQASRHPNTSGTTAQRLQATITHGNILYRIRIYSSDLSLSSASSISTLQVRELCPVSPQRPQRRSARTLFAGVSPSSRRLPAGSAIRSLTSPTVRVSSARIYRRLRALRFVDASTASRRRPISSYINTILCAIS